MAKTLQRHSQREQGVAAFMGLSQPQPGGTGAMPLMPQWTSVANPANTSPPRPCSGGMQPLKPFLSLVVAALFCSDGWTVTHRRREEELQYHLVRSWLPSSSRPRGGTATIGEAASRDIVASPRHKSCLALKRPGLH